MALEPRYFTASHWAALVTNGGLPADILCDLVAAGLVVGDPPTLTARGLEIHLEIRWEIDAGGSYESYVPVSWRPLEERGFGTLPSRSHAWGCRVLDFF